MNCGKFFIFLVFSLLKCCELVPIQNFEDNWNYHQLLEVEHENNSPILNTSNHSFILPIYIFARELKIQALQENHPSIENSTAKRSKETTRIVGDVIRTKISCNVCNLGVNLLYQEVKRGVSFQDIKGKFVSLCVTFKIENFQVCSGIFDTYGPEVIPVLEIMTTTPLEVCKLIFGEVCINSDVIAHEWNLNISSASKPQQILDEAPFPKLGNPVFKVLQISDTHYDIDYAEGTVSNCQEPLCCRSYSTPRENEEIIPAGRWGSYEKCDSPRITIENMLEHISLQHPDIDYILWTGDLPPHDIWNQTREFNLKTIKDTIEMVMNYFPNTPIFPAIGNHESTPAGNFAPPWVTDPIHSISWLYEDIVKKWSQWLPEDSMDSVRHGAFYSVLLRPGFRLISVNTNYCHSISWWLFINSTDPANELKWLINQLQFAENNNEKVHIIGHIAPGSADCMKSWSKNFYKIVNRYENLITGLFYGHSHADEFQVFYETHNNSEFNSKNLAKKRLRWWYNRDINNLKHTGRPTAVAYLAPSVTTFTNHNPAYRIYYIDGDHAETTREILEHETWTFNLNQANNLPENVPNWYKLYSATERYQMQSLRPKEWDNLIKKMMVDEEIFNEFYKNYYRNSPEAPQCDLKCRVQILCDLKSAKSHNRHYLCVELEEIVKN